MTATQSSNRRPAIHCAFILLLAIGAGSLAQAKEARSPDNA